MAFHKFVSLACTITTTIFFFFIEQVVEPYYTVEVSIAIISGLIALSIILVQLLSPLLPTFQSCWFDAKKETKPRSKMATKVDTNWEIKIKMLETKFETEIETKLYLPLLLLILTRKSSLNPSLILCWKLRLGIKENIKTLLLPDTIEWYVLSVVIKMLNFRILLILLSTRIPYHLYQP